MIGHELARFWAYVGGNVTAAPVCGALAVLFAALCRKPLARWWRKHSGQAEITEIRAAAAAAHQIAADLFRYHTGREHPAAPANAAPDRLSPKTNEPAATPSSPRRRSEA